MERSIKCPKCQLWFSAKKFNTCPNCAELVEKQVEKTIPETTEQDRNPMQIDLPELPKLRKQTGSRIPEFLQINRPQIDHLQIDLPQINRPQIQQVPEDNQMPMINTEERAAQRKSFFTAFHQELESALQDDRGAAAKPATVDLEALKEALQVSEQSVERLGSVSKMQETPKAEVPSQPLPAGWLVCVRGECYGEIVTLYEGENDVMGDSIICSPESGGAEWKKRQTEQTVFLKREDYIDFDGKRGYIYIPLCSDTFSWTHYPR